MCNLQDYEQLVLDEIHRRILENELEMWHRCYLPCGKTVLDLGAGNGETALFYLNHGAEKVVCIEGDPKAIPALQHNFGKDIRVIIVPLLLDHVKMDIDGGEEGMIVETHFPFHLREVWRDSQTQTRLWKLIRQNPP
jgi:predicted RNA methylase